MKAGAKRGEVPAFDGEAFPSAIGDAIERLAAKPGDLTQRRKEARALLKALRTAWVPIDAMGSSEKGSTVFRVARGDALFAQFDYKEMRKAVPRFYHDLLLGLFVRLQEQALFAKAAMTLADVELEVSRKRSKGGSASATARKEAADKRADTLAAAAAAMRSRNPSLSKTEAARRLADRGHGGKFAIRKILSRRSGPKGA